ncbi:MAG TPA: hypothetical protein VMJ34_15085, partial [Bryobacteraceae bacterium]|nr:hypothetical protein [Bryobacteraceae bacterium]
YYQPPEWERYRLMRTYYSMLRDQEAPDAVGKMKQFATYFTHGVRDGSKLRVEIYRTQDAAAILDLVDRFFARELEAIPA